MCQIERHKHVFFSKPKVIFFCSKVDNVVLRHISKEKSKGVHKCITLSTNKFIIFVFLVTEVENFLHTIQPWRVVSNREDRLILKGSNSGIYFLKLMYDTLNHPAFKSRPFPALLVWKPLIKVGCFAWGVLSWGKVLTLDQLKKKGKTLSKQMLPL